MKKFLSSILQWKQTASLFFTGTLVIFCVVYLIFGRSSIEIATIIWMMVLSAVGTFLQYLFFTDTFIKKLKYTARLASFLILFAIVFVSAAILLNWFPTDNTIAWLIFIGIYIAVSIIIIVIYEIYFSLVGKRYDGVLGQYKKSLDEKKNK